MYLIRSLATKAKESGGLTWARRPKITKCQRRTDVVMATNLIFACGMISRYKIFAADDGYAVRYLAIVVGKSLEV